MSELKAIESATAVIENVHLVYRKSEADKVIAELKAREDVLVTDNRDLLEKVKMLEECLRENAEHFKRNEAQIIENTEKELRHHKHKRCLAMAKWCFTKSNYHFVLARHGEDVNENNRKSILYSKWHKRWLAIAEKFKPNKEAK